MNKNHHPHYVAFVARLFKPSRNTTVELVVLLSSFFGLYLISLRNYPLFRSLTGLFSVGVAFTIFMLAWNTRQLVGNSWLLFLGLGYLFIGNIDLIHTLSYTGTGTVQGFGTNIPTQLWIAARYTESLVWLAVPLFLRHRWKAEYVFISLAAVTAFILVSIFYFDIFPDCYVEGVGLTSFMRISNYSISFIFLIAVFLLVSRRRGFDSLVFNYLVGSLITGIISELTFTLSIDMYGFL